MTSGSNPFTSRAPAGARFDALRDTHERLSAEKTEKAVSKEASVWRAGGTQAAQAKPPPRYADLNAEQAERTRQDETVRQVAQQSAQMTEERFGRSSTVYAPPTAKEGPSRDQLASPYTRVQQQPTPSGNLFTAPVRTAAAPAQPEKPQARAAEIAVAPTASASRFQVQAGVGGFSDRADMPDKTNAAQVAPAQSDQNNVFTQKLTVEDKAKLAAGVDLEQSRGRDDR